MTKVKRLKKESYDDTNVETSSKSTSKSKFYDTPATTSPATGTSFEDVIDLLSVSPSASDPNAVTWQDQLSDFFIIFLKYTFLVTVLTLNFVGLSVSLNCNADQELFTRVVSGVFAFFFGFVYLLINYYTYKVMTQGKICKMNREKLFPFN